MIKKFGVCLFVSLTLSMVVPLFVVDMYEPIDQLVSKEFQANVGVSESYIHETKKIGFFAKLVFYFSSLKAFTQYLEIVWLWFIVMFLASSISTLLNSKVAR